MPVRRGEPEGRLRTRAERRTLPRELPYRALRERPPGAGESGTEPEAAAPRGRDAADRREAHDGRAHPGAAPDPSPERLDQGAGRARQGQEHPGPPRDHPPARSRPRSPGGARLGNPGTPAFRPAPPAQRAEPRIADGERARRRLGTPASGRHRCAERSESTHRYGEKSARTAGSAGLQTGTAARSAAKARIDRPRWRHQRSERLGWGAIGTGSCRPESVGQGFAPSQWQGRRKLGVRPYRPPPICRISPSAASF